MKESAIILLALVTPFWVLLGCLWIGFKGYDKTSLVTFTVFCIVWIITFLKYVKNGNKDT